MSIYIRKTDVTRYLRLGERLMRRDNPNYKLTLENAMDIVSAIPGKNIVECWDCKHYRNHPNGLCYAWTEEYDNKQGYKGDVHCVEPCDFCSRGVEDKE